MREGPLNAPPAPAMYIPLAQRPSSAMYLVVRAKGDPHSVVTAIRSAMRAVDPGCPRRHTERSTRSSAQTWRASLTTLVLAIFAALALLLAAVGLYGVISYSVLQRTQELGIRAALGARRNDLMRRLVLSQSAGFTIAGIILGGAGALAVGQLIAHQLYGVQASDSKTFILVVLILAFVAALASAIPARRATRADPLAALRQE